MSVAAFCIALAGAQAAGDNNCATAAQFDAVSYAKTERDINADPEHYFPQFMHPVKIEHGRMRAGVRVGHIQVYFDVKQQQIHLKLPVEVNETDEASHHDMPAFLLKLHARIHLETLELALHSWNSGRGKVAHRVFRHLQDRWIRRGALSKRLDLGQHAVLFLQFANPKLVSTNDASHTKLLTGSSTACIQWENETFEAKLQGEGWPAMNRSLSLSSRDL